MNARLMAVLIGVLVGRVREMSGGVAEPAGDITRPGGDTVTVEPGSPGAAGAAGAAQCGRVPGWSASQAHAPVISQRFTAARDQVRHARAFVAELLGDDHALRDDAVLLTSELATNAVEHADAWAGTRRSDPGGSEGADGDEGGDENGAGAGDRPREFVVTVAFTPHGVLVTVQDPGALTIPCVSDFGPGSTGGRGLVLVNELAARWGFHRDATGTVVWFELGSPEARAG